MRARGRTAAATRCSLGESAEIAQSSPWADLSETDGFSRTDADVSATEEMINGAALEGEAGTSVYNSIISASTHNLMRDVNSAGLLQINAITGLDGRAALEAVWSVGRYVLDPAQSSRVPYGFTYSGTTAQGEEVYESEWALPIGYAMTGVVAQSDYDAMTPLEKQWALLQGAVLDEAPEGVAGIKPELSVLELDGVEVRMENIQSDGEMLTVGEDARITLSFDAPADCELYVELEGFAFQDGLIDLGNRVYFSSGGIDTDILLMPSGFELDLLDRGGYLVNLGYSSEGRTTAEITFARTGRLPPERHPHVRPADGGVRFAGWRASGARHSGCRRGGRVRLRVDFARRARRDGVQHPLFGGLDGQSGRRARRDARLGRVAAGGFAGGRQPRNRASL